MDGVLSQEEISALLAKDQGSADKNTDSGTQYGNGGNDAVFAGKQESRNINSGS